MVTLSEERLYDIISQYEQVGFAQAIQMYEPAQDLIRMSEVKSWLKMLSVDIKVFNKLVEKGVVMAKSLGNSKNSPKYYSKKEIKSALVNTNLLTIIRDSKLLEESITN